MIVKLHWFILIVALTFQNSTGLTSLQQQNVQNYSQFVNNSSEILIPRTEEESVVNISLDNSKNSKFLKKIQTVSKLNRKRRSQDNEFCAVSIHEISEIWKYLTEIKNEIEHKTSSNLQSDLDMTSSCDEIISNMKQLSQSFQPIFIQALQNLENNPRHKEIKKIFDFQMIHLEQEIKNLPKNVELDCKPAIERIEKAIENQNEELQKYKTKMAALWDEYLRVVSLFKTDVCIQPLLGTPSVPDDRFILPVLLLSENTTCTPSNFFLDSMFFAISDDMCKVKRTELEIIKNSLVNVLYLTNATDIPKFATNWDSSIIHIIIDISLSLKKSLNNIFSPDALHMRQILLNNTYNDQIWAKTAFLDNVIRASRQKCGLETKKIQDELQELKLHVTEWKNIAARNLTEEIRKERVRYSIHAISRSRYDNSIKEFLISPINIQSLKEIIKGSLDKDLSNFERTLHFIQQLSSFYHNAVASETLYNELLANNYETSPKLLLLSNHIEQVMRLSNYPAQSLSIKNIFTSLMNSLKNIQQRLKDFVQCVNDGNYGYIQEFYATSTANANTLGSLLPQIIHQVYDANVNNVDKIMKFLEKLYWISTRGIGFTSLYQEIKTNNHIDSNQLILFAFQVKKLLTLSDAKDDLDVKRESQHFFNNIKSDLPSGIRALLWNSWVKMEMKMNNDYCLYGNKYGSIYTFPWKNYASGENQKWKVTVFDEGRYFSFKNSENNKVLFADNEGHAYGGLEDRNDMRQQWEVIPIFNGKYYYFENRDNKRILDSNNLVSCIDSKLCCCSTVHSYSYLIKTAEHHFWTIA